MYDELVEIDSIKGMTMKRVEEFGDKVVFMTNDDRHFELKHVQDCCESVYLEDLCGDVNDLVGYPLVECHESSTKQEGSAVDGENSRTWSFYRFSTVKGTVTVRFMGESNGYYSESADLFEIKEG